MNTTVSTPSGLQSIPAFCDENDISKAFFYKLRKEGKAPKITKLGSRSFITPDSRQDWLESLSQEARA